MYASNFLPKSDVILLAWDSSILYRMRVAPGATTALPFSVMTKILPLTPELFLQTITAGPKQTNAIAKDSATLRRGDQGMGLLTRISSHVKAIRNGRTRGVARFSG